MTQRRTFSDAALDAALSVFYDLPVRAGGSWHEEARDDMDRALTAAQQVIAGESLAGGSDGVATDDANLADHDRATAEKYGWGDDSA